MIETIKVGALVATVKRSEKRKSIDLIVDRTGEVIIHAPVKTTEEFLTKYLHKKAEWVYKKKAVKDELQQEKIAKEFVSGEGLYFLGRNYRLKVSEMEGDKVYVEGDRLYMGEDNVKSRKKVLIKWYTQQLNDILKTELPKVEKRVGNQARSFKVLDLGFRWASCNKKGDLFFHWRVAMLPLDKIRYIIMHELTHLVQHNHSKVFFRLLARVSPDYQEMERWLERNGDKYDL